MNYLILPFSALVLAFLLRFLAMLGREQRIVIVKKSGPTHTADHPQRAKILVMTLDQRPRVDLSGGGHFSAKG